MATKVFKNIDKLDYTFEDGEILSANDLTSISDKIDEIIDVLNRDDIGGCSCNGHEGETYINPYTLHVKIKYEDNVPRDTMGDIIYKEENGQCVADVELQKMTGYSIHWEDRSLYYDDVNEFNDNTFVGGDPWHRKIVLTKDTTLTVFVAIERFDVVYQYETAEGTPAEKVISNGGKFGKILDTKSRLAKPDKSKAANERYSYAFAYWRDEKGNRVDFDTYIVTGRTVFTAVYTETKQKYSIVYHISYKNVDINKNVFKTDDSGNLIMSEFTHTASSIIWGTNINEYLLSTILVGNISKETQKFASIDYKQFIGGDTEYASQPIVMPTCDLHVYGEAIYKNYTVVFKPMNGESDITVNTYYGVKLSAITPENPSKNVVGQTVSFSSWKQIGNTPLITGTVGSDLTRYEYEALYNASTNKWKAIYKLYLKGTDTFVGEYESVAIYEYGNVVPNPPTITYFKINGTSLTSAKYSIPEVDKNKTNLQTFQDSNAIVYCVTSLQRYTLTLNSGNYVEYIDGVQTKSSTVNYGDSVVVKLVANPGYTFASDAGFELSDGGTIATRTYTVTKHITVSISTIPNTHNFTVRYALEGNTDIAEDTSEVTHSCKFGISLPDMQPNIGNADKYEVVQNSAKYYNAVTNEEIDNITSMPNHDVLCISYVRLKSYTISIVCDKTIGIVYIDDEQISNKTVQYGTTVSIKVVGNSGYTLTTPLFWGINDNVLTYTKNVNSTYTQEIKYTINTYKLTYRYITDANDITKIACATDGSDASSVVDVPFDSVIKDIQQPGILYNAQRYTCDDIVWTYYRNGNTIDVNNGATMTTDEVIAVKVVKTRIYSVKFYVDNTIINTVSVEYGKSASKPEDPIKSSSSEYDYTFTIWSTLNDKNLEYNFNSLISKDLNLYARFNNTNRQYHVTFIPNNGEDQNVEKILTWHSTLSDRYNKTTDAQYTYSFGGWYTNEEGGSLVTKVSNLTFDNNDSATVYGQYTRTKIKYSVDYRLMYGDTIVAHNSKDIEWGTNLNSVTQPIIPFNNVEWAISATAEWHFYNAVGDSINIVPVEDGAYAVKNITKRQYTVRFFNAAGDSTPLKTCVVDYGDDMPTFDGNTSLINKQPSIDKVYTFNGNWILSTGDSAPLIITDNVDVFPDFNDSIRKYKVTLVDFDGITVIFETTYDYGTNKTVIQLLLDNINNIPKLPASTDEYVYSWGGWNKSAENVTGEQVYIATYISTPLAKREMVYYGLLSLSEYDNLNTSNFDTYKSKLNAIYKDECVGDGCNVELSLLINDEDVEYYGMWELMYENEDFMNEDFIPYLEEKSYHVVVISNSELTLNNGETSASWTIINDTNKINGHNIYSIMTGNGGRVEYIKNKPYWNFMQSLNIEKKESVDFKINIRLK